MYDQMTRKWKILPNIVINTQNHTLATTVTQFSYFVVVYPSKVSFSAPSTHTLGATTFLSNPSATLKQEVKKATQSTSASDTNGTYKHKNPVVRKSCLLFICW